MGNEAAAESKPVVVGGGGEKRPPSTRLPCGVDVVVDGVVAGPKGPISRLDRRPDAGNDLETNRSAQMAAELSTFLCRNQFVSSSERASCIVRARTTFRRYPSGEA